MLVVLKIIRHCEFEGSGVGRQIKGFLIGLCLNKVLQVTNCFPFPKFNVETSDETRNLQMSTMRNLRSLRYDTINVGWYQNDSHSSSSLNSCLIQDQFNYQNSLRDCIVLIYDHNSTALGNLSIKAMRLTDAVSTACSGDDFSPENIKKLNLSFESIFEEIPICIKSSPLMNVMLNRLQDPMYLTPFYNSLDLASDCKLESNIRVMMETLDELLQETNKLTAVHKQNHKIYQQRLLYKAKRDEENVARKIENIPLLPDEDLDRVFKFVPCPSRLDSLLLGANLKELSKQINGIYKSHSEKLSLADALQNIDPSVSF